jgi:NifB/MoaA-like Fe-S oxidoreductase
VGIVPLGLSKHGKETTLRVHQPHDAKADLEIIHYWQEQALSVLGRRLFFASDEMYLVAGLPVPAVEAYEDFDQHENGIGMIRAFLDELEAAETGRRASFPEMTGQWNEIAAAPATGYRETRSLYRSEMNQADGPVVIVTGDYGARVFAEILPRIESLAGVPLRVLPVTNDYFGGNVAVSGLLVGSDVQRAIAADTGSARKYLIPNTAVPGGRFLDDIDIADVAERVPVPIDAVPPTIAGLLAGAMT